MKKVIATLALIAIATPTIAFAAETSLSTFIAKVGSLVTDAIPVVAGLALFGFLWGLMIYIFQAGNEDKKEQGKNIMIWGVIALFVMVAVWGIVRFIGATIGIDIDSDTGPVSPPIFDAGTGGTSPGDPVPPGSPNA